MHIKIVKRLINFYDIDGYIIPKNDEYFSEYSNPNRLEAVTSFTGSAGLAIILKTKNYLFVDGRYTLQAQRQSGSNFNIFEVPKRNPKFVLKNSAKFLKLGFDPSLFTSDFLRKNFSEYCSLIPIKENYTNRFVNQFNRGSKNSFFALNEKITGERWQSKVNRLIRYLKKRKINNLFISAPENVAWLLNIRGYDNPNSPIPNCKLILQKTGKIHLIADEKKLEKIKKIKTYKKLKFVNKEYFYKLLLKLEGEKFQIDESTCSVLEENLIKNNFKVIKTLDPIYKLKSIKNSVEINNTKNIHIDDGVAITKFLYWIKYKNKKKITEIGAEKKLEKFRKKNSKYLYPSFQTISASGSNGSIIHYKATKKSNKILNFKDLYLCDSGGQYKYGTTDVTRTICFSNQSHKIKENFTRVLKGHIAVVKANLNKLNKGNAIDKLARYPLKIKKLDYSHGTGHGVGYFLNVHEGPQAISKFNTVKLEDGMILSNEPGYYKKNKYGIRIENLIYVRKNNNKLQFENLTLAPIDKDLIDFKLLSIDEKQYLHEYHKVVYSKLKNYLNFEEKIWLKNLF